MKKNWFKGFVVGCIITSILSFSVVGFADSITKSIEVIMNNIKVTINGKNINMDVEPLIYSGRTYVPVRFVAENLGYEVKWNESTNTVELNNGSNVVSTPTTPPPAQQNTVNSSFIFRKVNFGMTKQQVINSEGSQPNSEIDGFISYKTQIDNRNASILYVFNSKNQLCSIMITYEETHTNKNDFISAYQSYKSMLTTKYGSPILDDITWKNDLFKDDTQHYGLAIATGDLSYTSKWTLQGCEIYNILNGDNYKCKLNIVFNSTVYELPKKNSGI